MNFLTKGLPTSLDVGSCIVPINTDFRVWMDFERLSGNEDEAAATLEAVFAEGLPDDIDPEKLCERLLWFYSGGRVEQKGRPEGKHKRIYDYDYDCGYVYAAFMQQYGINLNTAELHWWEYKALFESLTDKTLFEQIIGYRGAKIDSRMSKEQKEHIQKMKKIYALPLPQDEQEKEDALTAALLGDGDLTGLL